VIAQELQHVAPDMVVTDKVAPDGSAVKGAPGEGHVEGHLSVDPSNFVYMLINAVKELDARVAGLEAEIRAMRAAAGAAAGGAGAAAE
jgi:uncharacterized small protein (DUF1192 family)